MAGSRPLQPSFRVEQTLKARHVTITYSRLHTTESPYWFQLSPEKLRSRMYTISVEPLSDITPRMFSVDFRQGGQR